MAPFTAVLVLLISGQFGQGPIQSAHQPSARGRARRGDRDGGLAPGAAAARLQPRARVRPPASSFGWPRVSSRSCSKAFWRNLDAAEVGRIQNEIGRAVIAFQATAAEARSERMVKLLARSRTRARCRARCSACATISSSSGARRPFRFPRCLRSVCARSSRRSRPRRANFFVAAPPRSPDVAIRLRSMRWTRALQAYVSEVVAMRREGLTRALSIEEAERVFTLAFALEQLYRNFSDLERCVKEHAAHYAGKRPA